MATKAFKNEKIEKIKESIAKAKLVIATDYRGLSVEEITELRRRLQKEGSDLTVIKNTLAKIAIKGTEFEPLGDMLKGPVALALGFEDQVAPAKILTKFAKESKKTEILGAVLDGNALNQDEVKKLAELPSKEEIYAKMLGCINAPASGIANATNGVLRGLVTAMDAIREQKEKAAS